MTRTYNGMPATELPAAQWRKSRRSSPSGNCVELAEVTTRGIAVRDSQHPDGPALIYPASAVASMIRHAKSGELDRQ